jgi:hypothetical protein
MFDLRYVPLPLILALAACGGDGEWGEVAVSASYQAVSQYTNPGGYSVFVNEVKLTTNDEVVTCSAAKFVIEGAPLTATVTIHFEDRPGGYTHVTGSGVLKAHFPRPFTIGRNDAETFRVQLSANAAGPNLSHVIKLTELDCGAKIIGLPLTLGVVNTTAGRWTTKGA